MDIFDIKSLSQPMKILPCSISQIKLFMKYCVFHYIDENVTHIYMHVK